ncbi:hypothetical protein FACS1894152_5560 [Bacilli bacterium]|nr:hypothetical protein FACS1894152_5560 [Bacilli bacterium]
MYSGDSVHLQNFPRLDNFEIDVGLIEKMDRVRAICGSALAVRDKNNLRVRLPLNKITIIAKDIDDLKEFADIIMDEINVKSIEFLDNIEDYSENKLVLNFQKIGDRFGSRMPELMKAATSNKWKITTDGLLNLCDAELASDEFSLQLKPKKKNVFNVNDYNILIMLDLEITEELRQEGSIRDLVRVVQQFRKDTNLNISDRIELFIKTDYPLLSGALKKYQTYLKEQTLTTNLVIMPDFNFNTEFSTTEEIDKHSIKIGFNVVK